MIATLQTDDAKQSTSIRKLREEVVQLKGRAEGAEWEVAEWWRQTEELVIKLEAEELEKQSVKEELRSERLTLQGLNVELDEVRSAHQKALADASSLETWLEFLSSEEGKKGVVEEYRHGPVGKVELSLVIKAGFDYLKAQLPSDVLSSSAFTYPPRVEGSLSVIRSL